jgi:hypothetical protein
VSPVEPLARIEVGVVVERRKAKSAWVDFVWQPTAILAGRPEAAPWTVLSAQGECTTLYAGPAEIDLCIRRRRIPSPRSRADTICIRSDDNCDVCRRGPFPGRFAGRPDVNLCALLRF